MSKLRILQILIALFFLLSGISKLFPIEPFELLIYQKGVPWAMAGYLARAIVITEALFFLGLLWPLSNTISKKTRVAGFVFLIFASVYLIWGILSGSSQEDCGCFGTWMSMNHYWALLRNVTLLILLYFIFKSSRTSIKSSIKDRLIFGVLGLALATVVLVVNPPDQWAGYQKAEMNISNGFPFAALPSAINEAGDTLSWMTSGKQIVAFMTPGCPHCKKATMKLDVLSNKTVGKIPISIIFMGQARPIDDFWLETGSQIFPHCFMDAGPFLEISGSMLPAIFILQDGEVIAKHLYRDFNPDMYLRD